jgi:alpha-glucosidase
MIKKLSTVLLSIICCVTIVNAASFELLSPDSKLKIKLIVDQGTSYELWHEDVQLISLSPISLNLADGMIVGAGTVKTTSSTSVDNVVDVVIGKNKTLIEAYNELIVEYNENYKLIVRAYNEGVAYRFVTALDREITINREVAVFNFSTTPKVYFPECDSHYYNETGDGGKTYSVHQGFRNFERVYNTYSAPIALSSKFSVTPVLFEIPDSPLKVVITESDTYDYPGMYMERNPGGGIRSVRGMWAGYPKSVIDPDNYYSNHLVYEREDYIAKTNGNRIFPWRVMIVSNDDKSLLNNELVYLLAEPSRISDTSWIQPGATAWEWWHKAMLDGVNFPVGNRNLSVQMYKYYIDWASENGVEYMTFDAGYQESWLYELCRYAKQRDVKIIVWTWASCVREYPGDWIKKMKALGVAGAKIDFFERNDQEAMRWGYEFAQRLADSQMVGLFHGCPVPTGLNRTFPNILNFEAVRGAEDNFWRSIVTPDYHTQFPFIRALAGPYDYTPGSMRNKTASEFYPVDKDNTVPMSMGTRAHELSMYVIYDQWLGYLCDAPTEYNKYPDIKKYLSTVPTVWDKTVPLAAELGKYILIAKQKGQDWYVGGMTNWEHRTITVKFDFLKSGVTYKAVIFRDGPESSITPTTYVCETRDIVKGDHLSMDMAKGGGFAIQLIEQDVSGLPGLREAVNLTAYVDRRADSLTLYSDDKFSSVQIFDMQGRCRIDKNLVYASNQDNITLSMLDKGMYIAKINSEDIVSSIKFVY